MTQTDVTEAGAAPSPAGAEGRRPGQPTRRRLVVALGATALLAGAVLAAVVVTGSRAGTRRPAASAAGATRPSSPTAARSPAPTANAAPAADPDAPPPDPNPSAPGAVVEGGPDESDPVLYVQGARYFLYTSGIPGPTFVNVPVTSSSDFRTWTPVTDALPTLPSWVAPGYTWAPDVHRFGKGYVLYFTALIRGSNPGMECIGDAVGSSLTGPFRPLPQPFICQQNLGGDIDPRVFVAPDGSRYMLWKSDQNIGGATTPTQMWSQPLSADGLHLVGQPALLLQPDQPWEGTIVEAPDMVYVHGAYWMIFSGNWFNQPSYAIGAARCSTPLGPCTDLPQNPLLASNAQGQGPGEASLFADADGVWMLYSPWRSLAPHPDLPPRPVEITRLGFDANGIYLAAGGPPPPLEPLRGAGGAGGAKGPSGGSAS